MGHIKTNASIKTNYDLNDIQDWYNKTSYKDVLVLAIDIDNFKIYNAMFGREAGDQLILTIHNKIEEIVKKFGGNFKHLDADNFIALFPLNNYKKRFIAQKINEALDYLDIPNGFKPSVGICLADDRKENIDVLYEKAQMALSVVKNKYSEHIAFYDETSYQKAEDEQLLLIGIEQGLRNNEFTFRLQPQVNIQTGKICSFEALARWKKGNDVLPPSYFIDVMEKTGFVHALDTTIWEEVIKFQRYLLDQKITTLPIAMNVSRANFHFMDVADKIISLLKQYDVDPKYINIEVTESVYMQEELLIKQCVDKLRKHGIKILMDDFGVGSSSLSAFNNIDVDILKIDRSFIQNIDKDRNLTETIIRMARLSGIPVVAEGVETIKQAKILNDIKCKYGQGWYYYKELDQDEAIRLLRIGEGIQTNLEDNEEDDGEYVEDIHFDELIDEKIMSISQLNHLIGPLCIIELENNKTNIIQFNNAWNHLFKLDNMDVMEHMEMIRTLEQRMDNKLDIFKKADEDIENGCPYITDYHLNGDNYIFKGRLYSLKQSRDGKLYLLYLNKE